MEAQLKNKTSTGRLVDLYKKVFPQVARILHRYGAGEEDARDVFHDALLVWLELPDTARAGVSNESAYIVTIARNEWFRRVEKAEKLRKAEILIEEEEVQVSSELYNYLVRTGKKCMDLLQAFYYERLGAADIATRFGFSGGHSASAQKYKCLEKLRDLVKTDHRRKEDFYEN